MMVRSCSAGVNPTPTAPIPPPAQTPRARSAVLPAKARPAPAKAWRQPKRSVIRVEMLPILSDLPRPPELLTGSIATGQEGRSRAALHAPTGLRQTGPGDATEPSAPFCITEERTV